MGSAREQECKAQRAIVIRAIAELLRISWEHNDDGRGDMMRDVGVAARVAVDRLCELAAAVDHHEGRGR